LPADVLRKRLRDEIEARMDLEALQEVRAQESQEKRTLSEALEEIWAPPEMGHSNSIRFACGDR
jgi:hypothetical protein